MNDRRKNNLPLAILLLGTLLLAALFLSGCSGPTSTSERNSPEAQQLAQQLNADLAAAGLPEVPTNTLITLYGADGGLSCINVGNLQHRLSLAEFGSYPIGRRVFMDPKVLEYQNAVISTYCPDKLTVLEDLVQNLKTADTIP
ncbi:MAG: hypothetical protein ACK2T1_07225 [Candidatus Promineifilaceae bacterium]|jgi:hypothetical protein